MIDIGEITIPLTQCRLYSLQTLKFQISLKVSREEHQKTEQLHLNDKKMLQDQLHSKDRQYQDVLRNAKLQHSEAVERLRQSFEERAREIEKRYSDRYVTLRNATRYRIPSRIRTFSLKLYFSSFTFTGAGKTLIPKVA